MILLSWRQNSSFALCADKRLEFREAINTSLPSGSDIAASSFCFKLQISSLLLKNCYLVKVDIARLQLASREFTEVFGLAFKTLVISSLTSTFSCSLRSYLKRRFPWHFPESKP